MDDSAVRERIKRMLARGQLPREAANRISAGYGDGRPCEICGEATSAAGVTYELHFSTDGKDRWVLMHLACYAMWESERSD